jgi:hypothetical protein
VKALKVNQSACSQPTISLTFTMEQIVENCFDWLIQGGASSHESPTPFRLFKLDRKTALSIRITGAFLMMIAQNVLPPTKAVAREIFEEIK